MTVYRIQSKQNKEHGPYSSGTMTWACRGSQSWPTPYRDAGINRYPESDEYCGFDSAAKLLRWFRGFILDLLQAGYEIVALQNIKITAIGEYQVLFKFSPGDI